MLAHELLLSCKWMLLMLCHEIYILLMCCFTCKKQTNQKQYKSITAKTILPAFKGSPEEQILSIFLQFYCLSLESNLSKKHRRQIAKFAKHVMVATNIRLLSPDWLKGVSLFGSFNVF